jgi:hypothetical protein
MFLRPKYFTEPPQSVLRHCGAGGETMGQNLQELKKRGENVGRDINREEEEKKLKGEVEKGSEEVKGKAEEAKRKIGI